MDSIELKAICNECKKELKSEVVYRSFEVELIIEPCENCMASEREAGFEEGDSDGYASGRDAGYAEAMDEVEAREESKETAA